MRKSDQTVQCDVLTHCAHLYMLYEWVFCSHTPSVVGKFLSRQPKLVPNSEKNHECSDREECQEFKLLVVQLGPNLLTRTKATGLRVTLNYRTASRFEDRLDSHTRRFLRMLVLIVVELVDHEEWFYILVESLSHIRRAIFGILVFLEQNQAVDLMVVEHRLDSI